MKLADLCEKADPKPLLKYIKELVPTYHSIPIDKHAFYQSLNNTE